AEGADWLEKIVWHLDNPLGDTAVIANYALSELARKHVTVVLSGEGADELLYGYAHYANLQRAKTARLVPRPLRQAAGHLIGVTPVAVLDKFFDYPASMGRKGRTRLAKLAGELGDEAAAYLRLVSVFDEEDKETLFAPGQREGKGAALARVKANFAERTGYEPAEKVAHHEFKTWLPDDILFKMDKITMASSIEGRVPFLDHQLAEFTAALPMRFKLRGGTNKWLLRKAAREVLPKKIAERGKHAFFMPVTDSFQARIKAIAHDALSRESVEKRGYFDYAHVEKLFSPASRKSKFLSDKQIVSLTVLELWHRQFIDAFE
ncbi:MAG: asparagine synthase-related protein, partial [Candidatus Micrarchaeia archaeon]